MHNSDHKYCVNRNILITNLITAVFSSYLQPLRIGGVV